MMMARSKITSPFRRYRLDCAFVSLLAAAAVVEAAASQPEASGGQITGRVIHRTSGKPVPSVTVFVLSPAGFVPPVRTDAEGNFRIEGLAPGRYGLLVDPGSGYRSADRLVMLKKGESVAGLEIAAFPAASVSGAVWRARGRPAQGIQVWALAVPASGSHLPYRAGAGRTDDLGRFAIRGLAPGRYFIVAEMPPAPVNAMEWNDDVPPAFPPEQEALVSTYYPDVWESALASPLIVNAGQHVEGIEIQLARPRTWCVRSRLAGSQPPGPFEIRLLRDDVLSGLPVAAGQVRPGDGFQICGVPRGSYLLMAGPPAPDGPALYAALPFTMGSRSQRIADLVLSPLMPVSGRLEVEEPAKTETLPGPVQLLLHSVRLPLVLHQKDSVTVREPGSFQFPAVLPDEYWIEIRCPQGVYATGALYDGQDVLRQPFRAAGGELLLRLRTDGPTLRAVAVDEKGRPVPSGAVLLAPDPLPQPASPWDIRYEVTDQHGTAVFEGLAPGRYRILALGSALIDPLSRNSAYEEWRHKAEPLVLERSSLVQRSVRAADAAGEQ